MYTFPCRKLPEQQEEESSLGKKKKLSCSALGLPTEAVNWVSLGRMNYERHLV